MTQETPPARTGRIPFPRTFGERLRYVRLWMGWDTAEAAADATGIHERSWQRYEDGGNPRQLRQVVEQIARVADVDREWLMWGPPDFAAGPPATETGPAALIPDEWAPRDSNPDTTDSIMRSARQLLTV